MSSFYSSRGYYVVSRSRILCIWIERLSLTTSKYCSWFSSESFRNILSTIPIRAWQLFITIRHGVSWSTSYLRIYWAPQSNIRLYLIIMSRAGLEKALTSWTGIWSSFRTYDNTSCIFTYYFLSFILAWTWVTFFSNIIESIFISLGSSHYSSWVYS